MYISYCIFRFKEIAASFSVVGKLPVTNNNKKKKEKNIITGAFLKYFTLLISWLKYFFYVEIDFFLWLISSRVLYLHICKIRLPTVNV